MEYNSKEFTHENNLKVYSQQELVKKDLKEVITDTFLRINDVLYKEG